MLIVMDAQVLRSLKILVESWEISLLYLVEQLSPFYTCIQ